jgi:hypothetical protein
MALRQRFIRDRRMRDPATMTLLVVQTAALGALVGTALWAALYVAISLQPMDLRSAWRILEDFIIMHWIEGMVAGAGTGLARHVMGLPGYAAGLAGILLLGFGLLIGAVSGPLGPAFALAVFDPASAGCAVAAMFPTVWIARRLLIL